MAESSEQKQKVSACIITFNEESNIRDCLESLWWVDEIIIVDSFSTDATLDICACYTGKIFRRKWTNYVDQKSYAASLAKHSWVLSIDADERLSPELIDEIRTELKSPSGPYDGYAVPRHVFYLGRWINHGGWYPDYMLRLFRKDKGKFGGIEPHGKVILDGKVKKLKGDLWHFTYKNISQHLMTADRYSKIFAERFAENSVGLLPLNLIFRPVVKFFETYFYKAGILDGLPGFIISAITSFYIFLKYAKIWESRNCRAFIFK